MDTPGRKPFGTLLRRISKELGSSAELKATIEPVLLGDETETDSDDQSLVLQAALRLDAIEATAVDENRTKELAWDLGTLLTYCSSVATGSMLLPIVVERGRFGTLIQKYLQGAISRTSFLSFLAERDWPAVVRTEIRNLDSHGLTELRSALQALRVTEIERILGLGAG